MCGFVQPNLIMQNCHKILNWSFSCTLRSQYARGRFTFLNCSTSAMSLSVEISPFRLTKKALFSFSFSTEILFKNGQKFAASCTKKKISLTLTCRQETYTDICLQFSLPCIFSMLHLVLLILFFILITCLLDNVLIFLGEIQC